MRYMGIDPSLTSTGVVTLLGGDECTSKLIQPTMKGPERLNYLFEEIIDIVCMSRPALIAMEGYAFAAQGRAREIGEGVGAIKMALWLSKFPVIAVSPTAVKKYATGRGNANKDEMRLAVYKRWKFEHSSNDIVDAYVIARIARDYANPDGCATQAHSSVIRDLRRANQA